MNTQLFPVPFHQDTLALIDHEGEPFVAMKPIVENMGLDWSAQFKKISASSERWGVAVIAIPSLGGRQEALCLPLRKLAGWMTTIQPSRLASALQEKVIRYQNECDDALWDYWTKGQATRPGGQADTAQFVRLNRLVLALVKELKRETVPLARSLIHAQLEKACRRLDLPHLRELCEQHKQPMPAPSLLYRAMRLSTEPRFVAVKPVNSKLADQSVRCWVFEAGAEPNSAVS